MKLSPKQIAASAAGAVASALIASLFGEKGTIIGVALGSAVASTSTALVVQSIERTHDAVKQVVKVPKRPALLRRLGATGAVGTVTGGTADSAVTEAAGASEAEGTVAAAQGAAGAPASQGALAAGEVAVVAGEVAAVSVEGQAGGAGSAAPPAEETGMEGERRLIARSRGTGASSGRPASGRSARGPLTGGGAGSTSGRAGAAYKGGRIRWSVLALTIGVVFVIALVAVTGLELIAGKPISSLFGSSPASGGTSVGSIFTPSPTTTAPSPTTTTTIPGSTTTTTAPGTTTTAPGTTTTTTTAPGSTTTTTAPGTTTTTTPGSTTTTTTVPGTTTTTSLPSTGSGTHSSG